MREELSRTRVNASPPIMINNHNHHSFTLYHDSAILELLHPGTDRRVENMKSSVASFSDIYIPSRETSNALVHYDRQWNSWVHCATEYPRFQEQHDLHFRTIYMDVLNEKIDLLWLALYLGVICVSTYYSWSCLSILIIVQRRRLS